MTIKPRHCPPSKQCGCHLISASEKNSGAENWARGSWVTKRERYRCAMPPPQMSVSLMALDRGSEFEEKLWRSFRSHRPVQSRRKLFATIFFFLHLFARGQCYKTSFYKFEMLANFTKSPLGFSLKCSKISCLCAKLLIVLKLMYL